MRRLDEAKLRTLNFEAVTGAEDLDSDKRKAVRDPMSHRIIEKRRRDRMNSCLADLSQLIPSAYVKKSRGRIEKTEIIEMAIKHLKHLQAHSCQKSEKCELSNGHGMELDNRITHNDQYRLGYQECLGEAMHFLVQVEGVFPGDSFCVRLMNHLQNHCEQIFMSRRDQQTRTECANFAKAPTEMMVKEDDHIMPKDAVAAASTKNGDCDLMLLLVDHDKDPCAEALHTVVEEAPTFPSDCMHSNGGTSQLRRMLQSPNANLVPKYKPLSPDTLEVHCTRGNPTHCAYVPMSTSSSSSSSKGEEVYKFKTNIKDRFHADLQAKGPEDLLKPHEWFQVHSAAEDPGIKMATGNCGSGTVPAFALHPKGTFYVPLTLSMAQVLPYFGEVDPGNSRNVLHQIGIAVCFCR